MSRVDTEMVPKSARVVYSIIIITIIIIYHATKTAHRNTIIQDT